jgi:CcmD family protein
MKNLKKILCFLFLSMTCMATYAQVENDSADFMRSNGKIYVVVAVVLVVLLGLLLYVFTLDRKITRLEKKS